MRLQRFGLDDLMSRYDCHKTWLAQILGDDPSESQPTSALRQILALAQGDRHGWWVAGGLVRRLVTLNEGETDIDLFFKNGDQLLTAKDLMEALGFHLVRESKSCFEYSGVCPGTRKAITVQLVYFRYFESIDEVFENQDFTICQFALSRREQGAANVEVVCGEYALLDAMRRRLQVQRVTYGVSTIRRLLKYTRQGFTACSGALAKILEEIAADPARIARESEYMD